MLDHSLAELARGKGDDLTLALYPVSAMKGSRPVVVVHADPMSDVTDVQQGDIVTAIGWPEVGRAVVIVAGEKLIEPVYPCVSPVFRSMRFK